jgi:hypothetical protein
MNLASNSLLTLVVSLFCVHIYMRVGGFMDLLKNQRKQLKKARHVSIADRTLQSYMVCVCMLLSHIRV